MAASAASDVTDGPVLNFINKRLRALRKKLNRITQMEEGIAQGKPINKEQEETLRSKPSITAAIDELEKLRQPLSAAVNEEVSLAIERHESEGKVKQTLDHNEESEQQTEDVVPDAQTLILEDLLNLIYFGSMFDVKSQNDFNSIMLTRAHERECCLAYDYVTDDDATDMLGERDLDLLSTMGSLLISRPVASSLSHQNALQRCIEHAKLWLAKSDQALDSNSTVTYAGLREKLTKIMGSNYFTITPEMKAPVDVAASAAGSYGSFQVPAQVEGSVAQFEQKEDEVVDYQGSETYDDQSTLVEELQKDDEYDAENSVETSAQTGSDKSHSEVGAEYREQQHAPRRPYQNQRGGGRSGGGGGRRGYSNGRGGRGGGRGGGGPYQNGRSQYYDQPGGYYQRNYYNSRGRGGRGPVGNSYNNHAAGIHTADS